MCVVSILSVKRIGKQAIRAGEIKLNISAQNQAVNSIEMRIHDISVAQQNALTIDNQA